MKTAILIPAVLAVAVFSGCAPMSVPPMSSEDPFAQAEVTRARLLRLFPKTLLTVSDGDLVHPRLSPNSKYLVYADVLVHDSVEGTAVYITDLGTKKTRMLLGPPEAEKYKVYEVFVSNIEWLDNSRVEVTFADGDVGSTDITFDVTTGKALSETSSQGGDDGDIWEPKAPPQFTELRARILAAFSTWTAEVLDNTLQHGAVAIPGRGIILQRNYAGFDHDVWFVDLERKEQTLLLAMGEKDLYALSGGLMVYGGDTVFAVSRGPHVFLFLLNRSGGLEPLARYLNTQSQPFIVVRYNSDKEAMFMLRLSETYEQGHNPVLHYSRRNGLVEVADCRDCYDFDVSQKGDLAVFATWIGGRRQLQVLGKAN